MIFIYIYMLFRRTHGSCVGFPATARYNCLAGSETIEGLWERDFLLIHLPY